MAYGRSALAGGAAAAVWALQQPLDQRLLRCDYSDVAVLGKAVTRAAAGARSGLRCTSGTARSSGLPSSTHVVGSTFRPRRLALGMALTEHVALYPLGLFIDRYHPARGEAGVPPLLTNGRAFAQATWRHLLFGVVLGRLA